jgi:hypothetical protein
MNPSYDRNLPCGPTNRCGYCHWCKRSRGGWLTRLTNAVS